MSETLQPSSGSAETWRSGWIKFPYDPTLAAWVAVASQVAKTVTADPVMQRQWLQCEGTWFVGVDALPNDPLGYVGGSGPLLGDAVDFIHQRLGGLPALHPAQLSVMYPGYPRPRANETAAAFKFRQTRDAAHIDGILPEGPERRRKLVEPHAFILGLPLDQTPPGACPLVVWPDSPAIVRRHLKAAFAAQPAAPWSSLDITEAYAAARREVFATCPRLELPAQPGEAYLLHRLALHGVAPWRADSAERRTVAYFRPPWESDPRGFLAE